MFTMHHIFTLTGTQMPAGISKNTTSYIIRLETIFSNVIGGMDLLLTIWGTGISVMMVVLLPKDIRKTEYLLMMYKPQFIQVRQSALDFLKQGYQLDNVG